MMGCLDLVYSPTADNELHIQSRRPADSHLLGKLPTYWKQDWRRYVTAQALCHAYTFGQGLYFYTTSSDNVLLSVSLRDGLVEQILFFSICLFTIILIVFSVLVCLLVLLR